eukprot:8889792-Pyramimonas_sp.AAC.1
MECPWQLSLKGVSLKGFTSDVCCVRVPSLTSFPSSSAAQSTQGVDTEIPFASDERPSIVFILRISSG